MPKKPKPKSGPRLSKGPENSAILFWRATDWAALWEEYFLDLDPSGLPKWKHLWDFVRHHTENAMQRNFMTWYIGEHDEHDPRNQEFAFAGKSQDWRRKRESGGWWNDGSLKLIAREIGNRATALESLKDVGNKVVINSILRFEQLAQRLDATFQGRFFVDNLTVQENIGRAKAYLSLHSAILALMDRARDMYTKCHGIGLSDTDTFSQLVAVSVQAARQAGGEKTRGERVMEALLDVTMAKAHEFGTELPEDMRKKMIEVGAEPIIEAPKKGKPN